MQEGEIHFAASISILKNTAQLRLPIYFSRESYIWLASFRYFFSQQQVIKRVTSIDKCNYVSMIQEH